MSASRRELIAALGGAWLFASLGVAPAVVWLQRPRGADTWPSGSVDPSLAHVALRCGYGLRPSEMGHVRDGAEWLEGQLAPESIDDSAHERRLRRLETLVLPVGEVYEFHEHVVRRELQAGVLLGAVSSARQLRESVVEFWRDHFSLSVTKGECAWLATGYERDALRPHALGRFRDLLRAVLLHPAMLWYLDGRLNRADVGAPNENYARELLELHTLGLDGGYSQADIQAVARALSGWTSRALGEARKGTVRFDADLHDAGPKRVFEGELPAGLGAEEVERVIDVVCAHPSTSRFLAHKLCVRYIANDPPPQAVDAVAETFERTGGEIRDTLHTLFARDEFTAARGIKLKRPLHLIASALRACEAEFEPRPELLAYLERLGHAPYQWPSPDGYPSRAAHWRNGLLWRWRFANDLARNAIAGVRVDASEVFARSEGRTGFVERCFGRGVAPEEREVLADLDDEGALAAVFASPGFQRC